MNFGALKAVLFLHSMRISWEEETAFTWRAHDFKDHILVQNPQTFVYLKVRIRMNSLEFIFIRNKSSKSWEAH